MKILHIITGLNDGGAENTLFKICKYDKLNKHIVISLTTSGKYSQLLKKINIKVYCLNFKFYSIFKFFYLVKLIKKKIKPDIIQTWLVHGDFIGSLAAIFAGVKKLAWNIRYSNLELGKVKFTTILITKILAKISFFIPHLIILNSKNAIKIYEKNGYDKKKMFLIYNGYDLSILKQDKQQKYLFRKKYKIDNRLPVIGNIARYDIMKDHPNLLKALFLIKKKEKNFICVLAGYGIDKKNINLVSQIKELDLDKNIKLLGPTLDISRLMNGIDINVVCSRYGEGFPNVVAEAMACKTPCIATNLGDAKFIIGRTGWIVPIKNSIKLANAIKQSIHEMKKGNWNKRCTTTRNRIIKNFDIKKMISAYNSAWKKIL